MPVSHFGIISSVLSRTDKVKNIESILDVGIGFGKYGVLLRERYDVRFKRCRRENWKVRIDGVEIYKDYITPMHEYVYSKIYIDHIHSLLDKLRRYDVILALEVLEHMEKWKGTEVIKGLFNKCNKLLLISFPTYFRGNEGKDWPNAYERHRCLWTQQELDKAIGETEKLRPTVFAKEVNAS